MIRFWEGEKVIARLELFGISEYSEIGSVNTIKLSILGFLGKYHQYTMNRSGSFDLTKVAYKELRKKLPDGMFYLWYWIRGDDWQCECCYCGKHYYFRF